MKNMNAFSFFSEPGIWRKGNVHSHTTNSDGFWCPQDVVAWYEKHGYDFFVFTDHDHVTLPTDVETEHMLVIPGIEFGYCPAETPGFLFDALGINISERPPFLYKDGVSDESVSPQQIIDYVNQSGGMVILCHPYFMGNLISDYLKYDGYVGIEAYNFVCDEYVGRGGQEIYWDVLLSRGKKLLGFATDDSHQPDYGHGWIEVKAKEHSIPAIMQAIRDGHYYSTQGIVIENVTYTEDSITIEFDRPCEVVFSAEGMENSRMYRKHNNVHELRDGTHHYSVTHRLNGSEKLIRIELRDGFGSKAFTNPVYFE